MENQLLPDPSHKRKERLQKLLQVLSDKGVNQNQVARMAGVPPSYVSDVKNGNRAMTELFARRLGEEFRFDYRWLLGSVGATDSLQLGREVHEEDSTSLWLPVFVHPIQGPPRRSPNWDGSSVEVCGVAAIRAREATDPYVLHFLASDHAGRLRKHDLVLISQAVRESAEIHVIRLRRGMYLARKTATGHWERVAKPGSIDEEVEVAGHGLGILWGPCRE